MDEQKERGFGLKRVATVLGVGAGKSQFSEAGGGGQADLVPACRGAAPCPFADQGIGFLRQLPLRRPQGANRRRPHRSSCGRPHPSPHPPPPCSLSPPPAASAAVIPLLALC